MPILTRQALYDLVWAEPVRTIAPRFSVSDVWLKKVCMRAGVPVPERGYWAKAQAGKPVTRARLPPRDPGASDVVEIGKVAHAWRWDPEAELAEPLPEPPVFPEDIDALKSRVTRRVGEVSNVRDLTSPWGALRKLLEEDERRRERQRASAYPLSWDTPLFDSPFERRRLRFLNSLALGLVKAGARLEIRGKVARELTVLVADTRMSITFDHPLAKPNQHGEWSTRSGGVDSLKLVIGGREPAPGYQSVWQDADGSKLEQQLTAIVIELVTAGEVEYRARQMRHHEWLIERRAENEAELRRRREEAERKARERRLQEEKRRREQLFAQAQAWRTAHDIRAFVSDVLSSPQGDERPDGLGRWAAWALAEADAIDPVKQGSLEPPSGLTDRELG